MANRYWIGGAPAVAQVSTVQITGNDASTTYKLTVGSITVSCTGAGSAALTATALAAAWEASTHSYFSGVTASANSDTVTLTSDNAGVPFTATSSVTGGAGTIGSVTAVTANSGPNVFGTALNWSGGTAPTNGDSIVIGNSAFDILFDLDQSGSTFASVTIVEAFDDGMIGLDPNVFQVTASTTDTTVREYRECYLKCGATIFINRSKTPRTLVNFGSVQTTATITDSAGSAEDGEGLEPIRLLGTHASNALHVSGGIVGVATTQQVVEVSTFATVSANAPESSTFSAAGTPPAVNLGAGCTLTTINVGNATVTNFGAAATTVTVTDPDGQYVCYGTGAHTTVTNRGSVIYRSSGTLTTYTGAGTLDLSFDTRAKTITNCTIYSGATLNANTGAPLSVTFTNGIDLAGCGLADVTLDVGPHVTLTPSAI